MKDKHCKDCVNFRKAYQGARGAVYGRCKIRRPEDLRIGSNRICRYFKEKDELEGWVNTEK